MSEHNFKTHCNGCNGMRNHELLHKNESDWNEEIDDEYHIYGKNTYKLVRCCGCDAVSLIHESWMSEDTDVDGSPNITKNRYPPDSYRTEPKWIYELVWGLENENKFLHEFIREIYIALRNDSPRLATMGIRALLEHVMIHKVGDQGSFKANIDAFEKNGFISNVQRKILEPVLEVGHATMHRSYKPSTSAVGNLMDITESIIESVYINGRRLEQLPKLVRK